MNRIIFLITLLYLAVLQIAAQDTKESPLKFDKAFYQCENRWVVLPKKAGETKYSMGYVYIDMQAGFTLQLEGSMYINQYGNYVHLLADTNYDAKIRYQPGMSKMAILPPEALIQMDLPDTPAWMYNYISSGNTVSDLVRRGYFYNHAGASAYALNPLEQAYKMDPAAKGLAFELAYAYNSLEDYDKAEMVLRAAIERNPANFFYYRELGFSLAHNGKIAEAEEVYRKGISLSKDSQQKAEMAINMAQAYFNEGNKNKFKEWAKITKKYSSRNSELYKYIRYMESKI
jgi:tetratricopeptide (TPR) repeat protein